MRFQIYKDNYNKYTMTCITEDKTRTWYLIEDEDIREIVTKFKNEEDFGWYADMSTFIKDILIWEGENIDDYIEKYPEEFI